ncbi:hypothetical protein P409_00890 [Inquilinus limosus MP06]|uniref:Uncharacterized protein n=1 Tax=Inquilinus limosus MP06 TaxID=1398085 RepID=A0A0A0DGE1_9PROT|nr:hypothetical protein P409_00890 [Inquilinus limosus MP06]
MITDGITIPKPIPAQAKPGPPAPGRSPATATITAPNPSTWSAKPRVSVRGPKWRVTCDDARETAKNPPAKGSVGYPG